MNMNLRPWLLVGVICVVGLAGCAEDDKITVIDNTQVAGETNDDDDSVCEDGERKCDDLDYPWACVNGEWAAQPACPAPTYCNAGTCIETFIDFPKDESPHRDMIEWWYWTGHVDDEDGNRFGFEVTFFYGAALFGIPAWMINVAVLDVATGEHTEAVWLDLHDADEDPEVLNLWSRDASVLRGADGVYHISASTGAHTIELTLTDTQGPTYHGSNGSIRMSSRTADSFYYSRMRLAAEGRMGRGETTVPVTGEGWMDHQWGNFVPFVLIGWDWYSVQLDDGTELMFFIFRGDENDPSVVDMASGTFVDANTDQWPLVEGDVIVEPLDEWTSPTTGATYPQDWRLRVPKLDLDLMLTSVMDDAEMVNPMWNYWEGLIEIEGTRGGEAVGGAGFVELSGYAGRPAFWWLFPDMWD